MAAREVAPAVELRLLDQRLRANPPQYASAGAAGIDLRACIDAPVTIDPGCTEMIGSGIAIHIGTPDLFAVVAPRSGLGVKHGLVLANLVGIIDSDYTGEIKLGAWNRSKTPFTVEPLMRICQLLILPVVRPELKIVDQFSRASQRSDAGFGSTGLT